MAGKNNGGWNGDIGEVVFYADELSDSDRNKVESYLALKYGTSLDQSTAQNYTAGDGRKMWDKDATNASTYNNDIAGIGRDDASALGQIKSRSQNSDDIVTIEAEGEGTNSTPSFTDIDDLEFLTWGNDNGTTSEVGNNLAYGSSRRLARIWQVQEVGEVGTTTISFDLSDLALTNRVTDDFNLIIDSDTNFTPRQTHPNLSLIHISEPTRPY